MKKPLIITLAIIILLLLTPTKMGAIFILDQREQALIFRFGKIVSERKKPGLQFKVPLIEDIAFYDNRVLDINMSPQEVIALDRKRLIVDAFAKYRIIKPSKFYESVGSEEKLYTRLSPILESSIREESGKVILVNLISSKREQVMDAIRSSAGAKAKGFGIELLDVRIMRTDLPEENSNAIYERMKTQHEKEARQTRAEGAEAALKITSIADKDKRIILATANKKSQITRGEGDKTATKIFANAFRKDPDFFKFYRTMQAYRSSLKKDDTRIVISPNSDFLGYFDNIEGKKSRR